MSQSTKPLNGATATASLHAKRLAAKAALEAAKKSAKPSDKEAFFAAPVEVAAKPEPQTEQPQSADGTASATDNGDDGR